MEKVYRTRCIVKKDGKQYPKGSIIENLTAEEIQQGLAQSWLEDVGSKDTPTKPKLDSKDSDTEKIDRKELLKQAEELDIKDAKKFSNDEIRKLISEAKAKQ